MWHKMLYVGEFYKFYKFDELSRLRKKIELNEGQK